ncbi:unnamed protein product [Fusarium venenatum]|uniref:Uncharacterized protein n=1 Tax=Fusarium venenatum TaxID=56646 RepID=A0A2L2TS35_9HYPO|nr:uncharacterized protein FVRRES_00332 [Fusarium venenatum]CEI63820.1 unnamed protein product [Fusarium venenatum]
MAPGDMAFMAQDAIAILAGEARQRDKDVCWSVGTMHMVFMESPTIRLKSAVQEADMFSESHRTSCHLKAMFLCRYVPGRVQYLRHGNLNRTAPCRGYDSVPAVLASEGGMVNFPEAVVYRDDAIVPVAVITYLGY